ncbi:MAG TPA: NAD-dependent epimerase/dehydratase family protein [Actinomycetota bacterium]
MGPVFLTGGSGFVGGALLAELVREQRPVRALARSEVAAESVRSLGAQPIRGDLDDHAALLAGMRGCTTVFHAAGVNAMCVRDPAPMMHANVAGSIAVVRAAAAAGVPRIVYTSSAATIGEPEGVVGSEGTPHRGTFLSAYERSKFLAEHEVFELAAQLGTEVVSVNPSSVQGPGRIGGSSRLLLDLVNEKLPVVIDTSVSIVDVQDCTRAHLRAETQGQPGARYLINGASLTIREAIGLLQRICGRPRRTMFAPRAVAGALRPITAISARFGSNDPSMCPEMVRTLLHGHRYDGSLAERELGLRYTPLETTIRRTLAWYSARGLAPAPKGDGSEATSRATDT